MHCYEFSSLVSIRWSFSLVLSKNGLEYLTRTAQVFIPLMRFLLHTLFSSSFSVFLRHCFFFFHLYLFDGVRFQHSQIFVSLLFSEHSDFSWLGSSIPSVIFRFLLFIISMVYILYQISSRCPNCIFSLPA